MSLDYIRKAYMVPAKKGGRVEYLASDGELMEGTITGASNAHLRVRLDGNRHSMPFHPTWRLKYLPDGPCFDGHKPLIRERDHLDPPRDD